MFFVFLLSHCRWTIDVPTGSPPPRCRVAYVRQRPPSSQGTVGLELVEQVKELTGGADLDAIIVPIGGGGLISGVATAVKSLCPAIHVIGVEPQKAAAAFKSKQVLGAFSRGKYVRFPRRRHLSSGQPTHVENLCLQALTLCLGF